MQSGTQLPTSSIMWNASRCGAEVLADTRRPREKKERKRKRRENRAKENTDGRGSSHLKPHSTRPTQQHKSVMRVATPRLDRQRVIPNTFHNRAPMNQPVCWHPHHVSDVSMCHVTRRHYCKVTPPQGHALVVMKCPSCVQLVARGIASNNLSFSNTQPKCTACNPTNRPTERQSPIDDDTQNMCPCFTHSRHRHHRRRRRSFVHPSSSSSSSVRPSVRPSVVVVVVVVVVVALLRCCVGGLLCVCVCDRPPNCEL